MQQQQQFFINEKFCEMANMPEVGLEIFNAGGGWRDQNGPHPGA
ncbi:hypothetical protein T09_1488 [Trichinella sp. T9]|nr:hypothetical protein T09_1488 [Trichinella sp. T9]